MDGIGWFTYNTLQRIVRGHPEVEFHFLFDHAFDPSFVFASNVVPVQLFPPARHAVLNLMWFEVSVRRYLHRVQPDLFLSPDGIFCRGGRGKQVAVIPKITFLHNPADLKFSNRHYYNHFFPRFARKAARIATVSEFSSRDIATHYGIAPDQLDVVYNGINTFYHPVPEEEQAVVRQQYTGGKPYFLFVGTLSPRKNIAGLMQAFDRYRQQTGSDTELLIAGGSLYKTAELFSLQRELPAGPAIHFTGRLPNEELNRVLASATALLFVPFFEGFGIPLIEAMQCDVPVIASRVTSLPEVAGDAACYVDPRDHAAIAAAMQQVESNSAFRQQLIEKGRIRRTVFSWDRTATLLWESIRNTLKD